MRLVLDANVLFTAAHNPAGKARFLFEAAEQEAWRLITSDYAIEEARRNLHRKFPSVVSYLDGLSAHIERVMHDPSLACPPGLREKDQPIFSAARGARATHLLTGDLRDFGKLMNKPDESFGILIQTVAQFLASI